MQLRITLAVDPDEHLDDDEIGELGALVPNAKLSTEPGSVGVGAAGYGVVLVLEVAERVINDFGSMVGLGLALREWLNVRRRRNDRLATISDSVTLGVLAAASIPEAWRQDLTPGSFKGAQPLLGRQPPGPNWVGTDERDIWMATFVVMGGAIFVYVSPSGAILGYVRVPFQRYFDGISWIQRSPSALEELFQDWNHGPRAGM